MKPSNTPVWRFGLLFAVLILLTIGQGRAQTLYYGGDDNDVDSFYSTANPPYESIVYQGFTINSAGGWQVSGVFGNFLTLGTASSANWQILSGVSAGNGGTVVDSGTGAATVSSSVDAYSNTLYNVSVTGLNFDLGPGTYWLGLQPISSSYGYVVTTSGANSVGTSSGGAFYSNNYGANFVSATTNGNPDTFSVGLLGVPEPSSVMLTLPVLGLLVYWRARAGRRHA